MISHKIDQYKQLLYLTKLYLLREFSPKEWKVCDQETFTFFKERAQRAKKSTPPPKAPPSTASSPQNIPPPSSPDQPQKTEKKTSVQKEPSQIAQKSKKKLFSPAPSRTLEPANFNDITTFLQSRFPSLTQLEQPPDDSEAQFAKKSNRLGEVILLNIEPQVHPFLTSLCHAINQERTCCTIVSAQHIENEGAWEKFFGKHPLKLIIASDYGIHCLPKLMCYYREEPKKAQYYLANIPLLPLTDLSHYLNEPKLKPALWNAISQHLA